MNLRTTHWVLLLCITIALPFRAMALGPFTVHLDAATTSFVDTGIDIPQDTQITITATGNGTCHYPSSSDCPPGPEGAGILCKDNPFFPGDPDGPAGPNITYGTIAGKFGAAGQIFKIGAGTTVTGTGRLYVVYNDCGGTLGYTDNGGSFTITVSLMRPAAISLFCNRTGPTLGTADCAVTVGDAGGPPRSTPTGQVDLVATGGLSPSSGSCTLQQTPFSSGVSSCSAQFLLPADFPLGVAFPIEAEYGGDSVFGPASTSHSMIQAGCVGDPGSPCPGAVALTFADLPSIIKKNVTTVFECGNAIPTPAPNTLGTSGLFEPRLFSDKAKCVGKIRAQMKLAKVLATLSGAQIGEAVGGISTKDAKNDTVLGALKQLNAAKNQAELDAALNDEQKLNDLLQVLIKQQVKQNGGVFKNLKSLRVSPRAAHSTNLEIGVGIIEVKNNTRKTVKIKLTKLGAKLAKLFKNASAGDVDLTITIAGKRAGGKKYPFNTSQTVNFGLN